MLWRASVKAPLMCPKSSLSRRLSGSAPQLMLTKASDARPERPWIARATSSFPVPLSPVISTVELVGATARTISNSDAITVEVPTTWSRPWSCPTSRLRMTFSSRRRRLASASRTTIRSSSTSKGFRTYASAPSFRAATAVSVVPKAVITITMVSGVAAFTWRRISMPSPSGSRTSVTTMSMASCPRTPAAWARLSATTTSYPSLRSMIASISRIDCSSSTTRIRLMPRSSATRRPPPGAAGPRPRFPGPAPSAPRCRHRAPGRCGTRWPAPGQCPSGSRR